MEDREIIPRKAIKMNSWVRARITPSLRSMLDELLVDYEADESEFIRRLIVYAHKKRPTLTAEVIVPGKIVAQLSKIA